MQIGTADSLKHWVFAGSNLARGTIKSQRVGRNFLL